MKVFAVYRIKTIVKVLAVLLLERSLQLSSSLYRLLPAHAPDRSTGAHDQRRSRA